MRCGCPLEVIQDRCPKYAQLLPGSRIAQVIHAAGTGLRSWKIASISRADVWSARWDLITSALPAVNARSSSGAQIPAGRESTPRSDATPAKPR